MQEFQIITFVQHKYNIIREFLRDKNNNSTIMSGRGRKNSSNAGSSTGRTQNKNRNENKNKNEEEMKFATYGGGNNNIRVTYGTVKDHIYTQIKKNYKYGADVVRHLSTGNDDHMPEAPVRRRAKRTKKEQTEDDVKFEQDTMDMMFREQLKEHKERQSVYEQNKIKAYSLILGYCTKQLQNRIMEMGSYETEIEDKPYRLL